MKIRFSRFRFWNFCISRISTYLVSQICDRVRRCEGLLSD
ncbi:hypothetical protein NIES2104_57990 [Leptolyngbya sp. NIES-2104]|nr:hypothetical protein NIES2104_57990 [Leptolyngbya sp. NIES-2104]